MSLATRLIDLATAIGTDIKTINGKLTQATATLEPWRQVGAVNQPPFQNNWVAYDSSVCFRKDPFGRVHLRGSLNAGASGTVAFTLPVGYRPVLAGQGRARHIAIGNQTAVGQWEAQVNINPDGTVAIFFTGSSATSYVSLDGINFDSGSVTDFTFLSTGVVPTTLHLDPMHIVGAAGEPAFGAGGWTSYDGGAAFQVPAFRKDPFGRVTIVGSAKGGASGTAIFTLPPGYWPKKTVRFNPRGSGQGNTPWAQINVLINGQVVGYGDSTTALISLDGIEFDTENVSDVVMAGVVNTEPTVNTTLNWNTALTPGFYRSTNDGMLDTVNGPGDTLNPPAQAGIVTAHQNGSIVQRVWDLDTQKAWSRYRNLSGEWTSWAVELTKPQLFTESMIGGATPQDGDERYFQNAAMKALGIVWRFRYNASSTSAYKWEFIGGSAWQNNIATSENRSNSALGDLTTVGPSLTLPLSGDYELAWGGRIQLAVAGAAEGWIHMEVGGAYPLSSSAYASQLATAAFGGGVASTEGRVNGQVEGTLCRMKYATQANLQFVFSARWMRIRPIRVSGL